MHDSNTYKSLSDWNGVSMADIKDLEIRLKQCQDVMTNVIENLNYIDRELRLAKQNAQAPYQAGAPVNQGAYNVPGQKSTKCFSKYSSAEYSTSGRS